MKFRPCIDIHNGKVKQIVGGSLKDEEDHAVENYTADKGAQYFAELYQRDGLEGGHVILLNPPDSSYYNETKEQALLALQSYPGGLQLGGGINEHNAKEYLDAGASHVIVTSFVFSNGIIRWENMKRLKEAVGKDRIVIDLSCRKRNGEYYIVTDRWQKFTKERLTLSLLEQVSQYCDEFLIHGVDVEGHGCGFEKELVEMLGEFKGIPITYAGGIGSIEDIKRFGEVSGGGIDFTVGSALDIFGGGISYKQLVAL